MMCRRATPGGSLAITGRTSKASTFPTPCKLLIVGGTTAPLAILFNLRLVVHKSTYSHSLFNLHLVEHATLGQTLVTATHSF